MQLGRDRGARKALFIYNHLTEEIETSRRAFQNEGFEIVDLIVGGEFLDSLVDDDFEVVVVNRQSLKATSLISKLQAWRRAGHALVLLGSMDGSTAQRLRPHWIVEENVDTKSLEWRIRQFVDTFHFVSKNLIV